MDPLKKIGKIIKEHNARIPRITQWQEMKDEVSETMRDLKEFADKHVVFVFVVCCVLVS